MSIGKINKISLPVAIIISSLILGGFFYINQVRKQKFSEKQQIKEEQNQAYDRLSLATCLLDVSENEVKQWYTACKKVGGLTEECVLLNEMTLAEYSTHKNIPITHEKVLEEESPTESLNLWYEASLNFNEEKRDCLCTLPESQAETIRKISQSGYDACHKLYP